jgi:hypothetical protein
MRESKQLSGYYWPAPASQVIQAILSADDPFQPFATIDENS